MLRRRDAAPMFVAVALLTPACAPAPSSIEVLPNSLEITSTSKVPTLNVKVFAEDGTLIEGAALKWSSSAPDVVDVDAQGTLSVKKSGSANIKVEAGTISAEVPARVTLYSKLVLSAQELRLSTGDASRITASVYDEAGTPVSAQVKWEVADAAMATVDETGRVTAAGAGTTTLTAKVGALEAKATVVVAEPKPSLALAAAELALTVGEMQALKLMTPGMEGKVKWTSADAGIASVNDKGEVKGMKAGQTQITVTDPATGASAMAMVKVEAKKKGK